MGRSDLIGNGERHLIPPPGGELPGAAREERRPAGAPPKGRTVEVAPRRGAQRIPAAGVARTSASAPAAKVKPSILSTIKSKPKTVRK